MLVVDDQHGGTASQPFSVAVGALPNSPPLFVTAPPVSVSVGAEYRYHPGATDADGDALVWSLLAGPVGLEIDPQSGTVTWEFALPGSHPIRIEVADGLGGKAVQAWTLSVGVLPEDEHAPAITSVPPGVALPAVSYVYPVQATDPDGDPMTWQLVTGPVGMTIDALGRVKFVPAASQVGPHPVTIRVRDDAFGEAEQSYMLVVSADPANVAPYFVSTPGITCLPVAAAWTYAAAAVDPERLSGSFLVSAADASMRIR